MLVAQAGVQAPVAIDPIRGDDPTPRRLKAELTALRNELRDNQARGPIVERITQWHNLFCQELRNNPDFDLKRGTQIYGRELAEIFRAPSGPDGIPVPLPAELFDDTPIPIIQYIVKMLRNERSLFYCQEFDEEALRALAAAPVRAVEEKKEENDEVPAPARSLGISPEILERLRLAQNNLARARPIRGRGRHLPIPIQPRHPLEARLRQEARAAHAAMADSAQRTFEGFQRIREQSNADSLRFLQVIALRTRDALQNNEEAEILLAEIPEIRNQNRANAQNIIQVERGNQQLQQNINTFREETNKKKSNWLESAACLVATVAISWILQTPVHITALPI